MKHKATRLISVLAALLLAPGTVEARNLARTARHLYLQTRSALSEIVAPGIGYLELHTPLRYPVSRPYQYRVSDRLTRGSRLESRIPGVTEAAVARLKATGHDTLVSLTAESKPNERQAAARLGLAFENVRIVDNTVPTMAQAVRLAEIVRDKKDGRIFWSCEKGTTRTGTATAITRMAIEGWPAPLAIAEAKRFGQTLRSQAAFLRRFGAALGAGQIPGFPLKQLSFAQAREIVGRLRTQPDYPPAPR